MHLGALISLSALLLATTVLGGADAFLGEIILWTSSRIPSGWAACRGQLLPISQYQALYSLIGPTYGGDGQNTFALPNLQDRIPRTGPAGSVGLTADNIPAHVHPATFTGTEGTTTVNTNIQVATVPGQVRAEAGGFLSQGSNAGSGAANIFVPASSTAERVALAGGSAQVRSTPAGTVSVGSSTGAGTPVNVNLPLSGATAANQPQPYLGLQYIIAVQGIYPQLD